MIVLADRPETLATGPASAAAGMLAPGGGFEELAAATLPPGEGALWRALGGGERVWRTLAASPGGDRFWWLLAAVAEAPRSQFDALRELLGTGAPELPGPVATLAGTGHGFHGHRGQPWSAVAGNLHLCAALRPAGAQPLLARHALALTALPAVATVDALRGPELGALPAGIKWVNDVLVKEAKLAGVLAAAQTHQDRVAAVAFGVGVNVGTGPGIPPTPFLPAVACLADHGVRAGVGAAARAIMAALAVRWRQMATHGPGPLLEAYRAAFLVSGRSVAVWPEEVEATAPPASWPEPLARGVATAIEDDLSLRISAGVAPAAAGEVAVRHGRLAFAPAPEGTDRAYATYCSAAKRRDANPLPVAQRYLSERIRAVARRAADDGARLLILSGRYGLLSPREPIPWYDHLLTAAEAPALALRAAAQLRAAAVRELVWFTASPAADPNARPYGDAVAAAATAAGVALRRMELAGPVD